MPGNEAWIARAGVAPAVKKSDGEGNGPETRGIGAFLAPETPATVVETIAQLESPRLQQRTPGGSGSFDPSFATV